MGDRTPFTMTVYACPVPEEARAIMQEVENLGLSIDWEAAAVDPNVLPLCVTFTDAETNCGTTDTTGRHLAEVAPNATWELQEDPKYDWLGSIWKHDPELGDFTAEGDAQGESVWSVAEVERFLKEHDTIASALAAMPMRFGTAWDERFAALMTENEGKTVAIPEED